MHCSSIQSHRASTIQRDNVKSRTLGNGASERAKERRGRDGESGIAIDKNRYRAREGRAACVVLSTFVWQIHQSKE